MPGGTALASGRTWTGAWASPSEGVYTPPSGDGSDFGDQTIRTIATTSIGGSQLRLRLSDDLGWLAGASSQPLNIGAVTVAVQSSGAGTTGTPTSVTFGGAAAVTVPEGGDMYSDPVPITVTPGEKLVVSIYLSNTVTYLVRHSLCSACTTYVTTQGSGDHTGDTSSTAFTASGTWTGAFSDILTGIDTDTADIPTAVVLGDNVIDGSGTAATVDAAAPRLSDDLTAALQADAGSGNEPTFGVVAAGIESNEILTDQDDTGTELGGAAVLSRLARDMLTEPNLGTVVVDEGLEDLLLAGSSTGVADDVEGTGYGELSAQLSAWGITAVVTTSTPCTGYAGSGTSPEDACSANVDANRLDVNSYVTSQFNSDAAPCQLAPCTFAVDFDAAVTNGASPEALITADDQGDHANLSAAGYSAITNVLPPDDLTTDAQPAY
jgi:hypothetical protein